MGIAEDLESPQCARCKWKNEEDFLCPAFPFGIPDEILNNRILHEVVLPTQEGTTVFTPL